MEQNGDDNPANRDRPADEAAGAAPGPATTRLGARYTVREAAEVLGTTIDGVRGRIRRGTLDSMKVEGVVYVLLDEVSRDLHADGATNRHVVSDRQSAAGISDPPEMVEELRDQVGFLRRELERRDEEIRRREEEHREEGRRKDHIIAALTQRIPELEAPAPPEPREPSEDGSEDTGGTAREPSMESQEPGKRRSWLARLLFGPLS